MLTVLLNIVGLILVAAVAVHSIVLHARLRRFRHALAGVGDMMLTLDASVERMTEVATGFSQRLHAELETVEGRVSTARRLAAELAAAGRAAEAACGKLERLLRQHRQIEAASSSATPRERVEPKGFAERFARAGEATSSDHAPALDRTPVVDRSTIARASIATRDADALQDAAV
jgi:uncharacterized protein YoxC